MAKYKRRFVDKIEDRDPNNIWMEFGEGYVVPQPNGQYAAVAYGMTVIRDAGILFQTQIVKLGQSVERGKIVASTTQAWSALREELLLDPSLAEYFPSSHRKFEEFVAGAYRESRWSEVTLSPPSNDGGFDIAAKKRGRQILDETKAYKPSLLVNHQIVRAALGLREQHNGIDQVRVTTTSTFAPTIPEKFRHLIPKTLILRDLDHLLYWLETIGAKEF